MSNLKERVQQMLAKSSQHEQVQANLQHTQVKVAYEVAVVELVIGCLC